MGETCPSCGVDFPEGLAIMCKCWEGTEKQKAALDCEAETNKAESDLSKSIRKLMNSPQYRVLAKIERTRIEAVTFVYKRVKSLRDHFYKSDL